MRKLLAGLMALCLAGPTMASDLGRDGGPSKEEMLVKGQSGGIDGISYFRPVLSGVLYRSGFKGGDKNRTGLSDSQRKALCNKGFSAGFYADFGKNTDFGETRCDTGNFDYQSARSSRPSEVMKAVHRAIKSPNSGPVLVHCMWGVHSSGALSAMALVQFCGWSEDRAKSYWNEARNNAPCSGGCDKWIDGKFSHFKADTSLTISKEQQQAICPK